ncbi:MAG: exonuclease domain-containing protein [Desulfobacterales bacterium]|jgi:DNA polymerase-3 subunit epsilon
MDPTNKFWWFAGVSFFLTLLIFITIALFFWQQLLPDQQATLIAIAKSHFIYLFITLILLMATIGFGLDAIFHSYILPLNRLPEEIEIIHTVNSSHRIKREGSKLVNLVIDAINENANHYQALECNISSRVTDAKSELEKEKNILAVIMSELPEGVLICNRDGQILFYNKQTKRFFTAKKETPSGETAASYPRRQEPYPFFGLGRSVFEIIDRNLISHALDEINEKLESGAATVASYFVVVAKDGRHLRTEMVPVLTHERQFTGFILIFSDISTQMESDSRTDLLLQSMSGGIRAALAGLHAAVETMMEFPDMSPDKVQEFNRIIYYESLKIGKILSQHSRKHRSRPRSPWPLIETRADTMLEKIAVKAKHLLQLQFVPEIYDEDLQLSTDSFAFTLAVLFLLQRLSDESDTREFSCRVAKTNGLINFDLRWQGKPIRMETIRRWEEKVLSLPEMGLPLTLGEVIRFHNAEFWPYTRASHGWSVLRIIIPALPPASFEMTRQPTIIPDSRPEFYDFDLFNQPGQDPAIDNCLLTELTYTVFDTETTGLDPRGGDEIISIGAVRIVNHRLMADDRFEQLVNPMRPLRWESIQIHGIQEETLRHQPVIATVLPRFHQFAENTILVAHNAAFDMRMLQMKEEQTGVRFENPVLDTMLLSSIVHPAQENHNLSTIAQRLGIDVTGRHTAMGDALATAQMFLKLIPLLELKGIRTLRQARLASEKTFFARLRY